MIHTMPFDDISALIEQRTGLSVRTRFRSDLHMILEDLAAGDLPGFYHTLRHSHVTDSAWQAVVRALTIGETYFFRDESLFQTLRAPIFDTLLRQRRQQNRCELNIWCAGCATGEEPYSIAILLHELLPDADRWAINLIATDINQHALQHARAGIYRQWAFRHTRPTLRAQYFDSVPDGWQIKPALREKVLFRQANLLDPPPLPQLDVIFCRNVLIYLTREHVAKMETTLFDSLTPNGWLVLGQSEAIHTQRERWITHIYPGAIAYQKTQKAQPQPITRRYKPPISNETAEANDSYPPQALYDAAVDAVRAEQPAEAERLLAELLAEQPQDVRAHTLLAYIFANRQAVPEAHAHLNAALKNNAMFGDAYYLRATLHLETGEQSAAEEDLRAALYCQRNHPLATFMLGNVYAQHGDVDRATRTWEIARELVNKLPPETPVSDLSDMTATTFSTFIQSQLDSLEIEPE